MLQGMPRKFGRDITNIVKGQHHLGKEAIKPYKSDKQTHIDRPEAIEEYHHDIRTYLVTAPSLCSSLPTPPVSSQITDKMHQILVDWLVDVHMAFQLKDQTLHLAVLYLEHYQSLRPISKDHYQLVGIACLWMASKYEEIYPPRLSKFAQVTAFSYSSQQIKYVEGEILQAIGFRLTRATSLTIFQAHHPDFPSKNAWMARFILELALIQGLTRYNSSTLAAAAASLSKAIYPLQESGRDCEHIEGVCEKELQGCFKELCLLLKLENKYKLTAVRRKYSKAEREHVGKVKLGL